MPSTIFADPIFPGAKIITASLSVSNTSGAYSTTVTDDRMTGSMKAIALEIDDPSVFNGKISVNATAGQYVFSCPDVAGSTTVVISFIKTADDPTQLTSSEFDVLNNRIGDLTTLTTTEKTSAVAAINEVNTNLANLETKTAWVRVKRSGDDSYFEYCKMGNLVWVILQHKVSTGSISSWTGLNMGTLPVGYRPYNYNVDAICLTDRSSSSGAVLTINTSGVVWLNARYNPINDSSDIIRSSAVFFV